jgi:cytidylate kinase
MKYRGVIISGLPHSGKSTISKMTEKEYGWPILYLGQKVRDRHKLEVPDGSISLTAWWKNSSVEFNMQLNEEARRRMQAENLTVDSRYTAMYTQDMEDYCKIFVTASLDARIFRAGLSDPKSGELLAKEILAREAEELSRGQLLFKGNYRNRKYYNRVLDTTNKTIEQELEAVREILGKPGS